MRWGSPAGKHRVASDWPVPPATTCPPRCGLLRDGVITTEHVQVIAKSVADLPDAQVGPAVDVLNELATQAGVDDLAAAGRHLNQVINPDGSLAQCEKDYTRRRLFLSPMLDGMVALDGILDAEAGATLTTALQPFLVPTDPTDDRDTAQRRADGLVELAHLAMSQGQLPVTGGSKPKLNVLTTLEALTELRGAMSSRVESTGAVIGTVTTERIACDATVTRVLLDPEGVPVGLGRSQRLFTPNNAVCWPYVTVDVDSPTAACPQPSPTPTTSHRGQRADRPTYKTS